MQGSLYWMRCQPGVPARGDLLIRRAGNILRYPREPEHVRMWAGGGSSVRLSTRRVPRYLGVPIVEGSSAARR
jgi:hypothetical protein